MKSLVPFLFALGLCGAAQATPCGDRIAELQQRFDSAPPLAGSQTKSETPASTTVDAKLHHQPAPADGADAAAPADSPASRRDGAFKVRIEEARAADHAGDEATCEKAAAAAEGALSR